MNTYVIIAPLLCLVMDLVREGLKGRVLLIFSHPDTLKRAIVKMVGLWFIHQGKRPTHIRETTKA
jgi:hypothetical protein